MRPAAKMIWPAMFLQVILGVNTCVSQDLHFSQIHASPLLVNPAYTGVFDGDYRFIVNYKQQWRIATANFNTIASSFDSKVFALPAKTYVNAGFSVISDKAGDLNFAKNYLAYTMSVVKAIDSRGSNYITMGIENAMINQTIDLARIRAYDQDQQFLSTASSSIYKWDISVGGAWYCSLTRKSKVYTGFALYHINEPIISFSSSNASPGDKLYRKKAFSAGGDLHLYSGYTLMPSVILFDQGPHREITVGSYFRKGFAQKGHREETARLYAGMWVRWSYEMGYAPSVDAAILSARVDYNGVTTAFSYDVNISTLARSSKGDGGPEVSVIYILGGNKSKIASRDKRMQCPVF